MELYVELYIFISVFCSLLLLTFAVHSRIGMGDSLARRYFAAVIYASITFFASDAIWFAMNYNLLPQVWWVGTLLNNIYFISVTIAGYFWFMFLLTLVGSRAFARARNMWLAFIPVLIHIALCIYNLFNPILFGINEDFTYFRGPIFAVQYVFYFMYTISVSIYTLVKAFRPENYIERSHYLIVATFPLFPVTSGTLELFFSNYPFNCMSFTLVLTIVYINELYQQVSQEPLTQLANRKQFMRTLEHGMQQHRNDGQLFLFMMDLDHFKAINDTYGHYEGDQALLRASDALRRAVSGLHQRATIARYAGDEFAIIAYFDDPADALKLKATIQRELEVQNQLIEHGYRLSMSIGIAQFTPDMHGFKDFLDAADSELYREKAANG